VFRTEGWKSAWDKNYNDLHTSSTYAWTKGSWNPVYVPKEDWLHEYSPDGIDGYLAGEEEELVRVWIDVDK
jgi:hypothetical protein